MDTMHSASLWQMAAAAIIFLIAYGFIQTGIVHRAYAAWGGAILAIILGLVDLSTVYRTHIAWETLLLLLGLMLMSGMIGKSGLLQYAAVKSVQMAEGRLPKLLVLVAAIAALGSAVLDPVTTLLLLVPVTIRIAKVRGVSPVPFLVTEMLCGNIGGSATMIGSLPNMMLGSSRMTGITFNGFLLHVAPLSILLFMVTLLVLYKIYAKEWSQVEAASLDWKSQDASGYIKDRPLLIKTLIVWGLTLIAFLFHVQLHTSVAIIALAGAFILILLTIRKREELEDAFHSVEWGTLIFLLGLFVMVGGLVNTGLLEAAALKGMELTSGNMMYLSILVLWVGGLVSAGLDQAPLVAAMIPLIKSVGGHMDMTYSWQLNPVWWSLAIGASLGGGATLIGSHANLIAAGLAMKEGTEISFIKYLKIALPVTLLLLLISTAYVIWIYF